ncbi:sugar phosphate isomerase/epimerase family protein [Devosia sp. RR2S18]|uniref:sugar phosphate isomerase/epimerase family protein n=1 Tax=Devosia rhizosphaerae TaxID=3049774 RepID=UPI0025408126|nr:sugar phosphate isomerase/epimerase family protein [Devosia sp. RR2S18]WIJ25834.1 sugar phosphate isomerase/epimerase family protein [Devosia sp. RR2S18]
MKLAVQENLIPGRDLISQWRLIQEIGYEGIELRGSTGMRERLPELQRARAEGVVFSSICVISDRFIGDFDADRRAEALSAMTELCDVAGEVGATGVITPASYGMHSDRLPPFKAPREPQEDRAILLQMLGKLGEHARSRGVTVLLEPLNRYEDHMVNTLRQGAELCRSLGLHSVRLMADLFHMNIEEASLAASLREAADVVAHVHLADSSRLEPGTGHTDFASAFAALEEIGFKGCAAMECRFSVDPEAALRSAYQVLRRSAAR